MAQPNQPAALQAFADKGLPVPGLYAGESAAADKAYQDAIASIAQQQSQLAQKYGFKVNTDQDTGALTGTELDPSQQFSMVMNMLNGNAQGMHSLREGLSGRGLTGGGLKGLAGQRAQLLRFQQQGNLANLGSAFAGQYGQLDQGRASANATRNQGYNQAALDALNFAIANGMFNPPPIQNSIAAPGGGGGGGGGNDPGPQPQDLGQVAAQGVEAGLQGPQINTVMPFQPAPAYHSAQQAQLGNALMNVVNPGPAASGYSQRSGANLH